MSSSRRAPGVAARVGGPPAAGVADGRGTGGFTEGARGVTEGGRGVTDGARGVIDGARGVGAGIDFGAYCVLAGVGVYSPGVRGGGGTDAAMRAESGSAGGGASEGATRRMRAKAVVI